ncbi:MAG TPA: (Fe-S)-binding protein, partial [Anaerolineae bacterium]|nr:(Fe-S)-binding protein [Anaerolineae bacterium]
GLFFLIGLGMAFYRRYLVKPPKLTYGPRFTYTLIVLGIIVSTGLLVEGLRLAVVRPAWGAWSVIGYALSALFQATGANEGSLRTAHLGVWWIHSLTVALFIATLPQSFFWHLLGTGLNMFFTDFRPRGALAPIENIEEAELLGVGNIAQFPWTRFIEFDSCTECGRCQDVCPAYAANQPLNPKQLILDLRDHMWASEGGLLTLAAQRAAALGSNGNGADQDADLLALSEVEGPPLIGDIIRHDTVWACTTCQACVHECPVLIQHVDDVMDMRRYLTLMEGNLPETLAGTLQRIETSGNPWGMSRRDRTTWTQRLDFEVPLMAEKGEADVLFWVGCAGSYDPRNQKVSRAVVKIFHAAGVDFAILGEEENCSGDSARRSGNEYLFQMLAEANVETLKQYRFNRIVTQCPHCFNTIKNEYPQFGGEFGVVHHTEFIQELIAQGKIKLKAGSGQEAISFHDPCYLGRYNNVYNAPRELLSASGFHLVELPHSRDRSFCCGGGGARVWMEDRSETPVAHLRLQEIVDSTPGAVAVGCPFCMIMLEDAAKVKGIDETLTIKDVAELVAERL